MSSSSSSTEGPKLDFPDFSVRSIQMDEEYQGEEDYDDQKLIEFSSANSIEAAAESYQNKQALYAYKWRFFALILGSVSMMLTVLCFTFYFMRHPYEKPLTAELSASVQRTLSMMNQSADVCTDPYTFFCGGFLGNTSIPAGRMHVSASFDQVRERVDERLLEVMEEARHWPFLTTLQQSCLNQTYRSERALKPISAPLVVLYNAQNLSALLRGMAQIRLNQGLSVQPFFSVSVEIDVRSTLPMKHMLSLGVGSTVFSDPAYYHNNTLMNSYAKWIQLAFNTAGFSSFTLESAREVVELEAELESAKMSKAEAAVPTVLFNSFTTEEIYSFCPVIRSYIEALLPNNTILSANVEDVTYALTVCPLLNTASFETLKNTALLSFFVHSFPYLGPVQVTVMDQLSLLVYGSDPSSKSQLERCTSVSQSLLGMLVSQYYVDKYFSVEEKQAVKDIISEVKDSFVEELDRFEWMDDATRAGAEAKFSTLAYQIGFPDEWPSIDRLVSAVNGRVFTEDRFFENVATLNRAHDFDRLRLLRLPVTFAELHLWSMDPIEVNAYYSPESNSMVFPAAILQEPFFSPDGPNSLNFGSLGAVAGHEIGHMNSGVGSYFNSAGQLSDWITEASKIEWAKRMSCFEEAFSELTYDGIQVSGVQVLGEAVADYWGFHNAYMAMKRRREQNLTLYTEEEEFVRKFYDMTPDQLFITSFAQTHCSLSTDQYNELLVRLDVHPLSRFRVERTLANSLEFGSVWNCAEGTLFNPTAKCALD